MKLNKKLFVASLAFAGISGGQAFAAGYSTDLTSTSGLANSYAGSVTGIHDVSDMFFNPATLTDVKNGEFVLSVSYKDLTINPQGARTASGSTRGDEVNDAGVDYTLPALYVAKRINDEAVFGLAITSPFGVSTKYGQNWQGMDRANETSIQTLNINPTLAYKINDKLSLGAGFQAQYYQAVFTAMTSIGGGNYSPNKMRVSDWGYGYNLGAKYQVNDAFKLGIGYRSKIDYKLTGRLQVVNFRYSDVQARLSTPEALTGGAAYKFNKDVELAYDLTWTRWSRVNNMSMTTYQNSALSANALQTIRSITFKDSFMHSLGANFALSDKWLLRTGVSYEKETSTHPRVPAGHKIWASCGFNYKFTKTFSLDAAYVHQFHEDPTINLDQTSNAASLNASYDIAVDIISLAVRKEF